PSLAAVAFRPPPVGAPLFDLLLVPGGAASLLAFALALERHGLRAPRPAPAPSGPGGALPWRAAGATGAVRLHRSKPPGGGCWSASPASAWPAAGRPRPSG